MNRPAIKKRQSARARGSGCQTLLKQSLAVALVWLPTIAHAQDEDMRARHLFEQGTAALQEGRFAEARTMLREAHALASRPATAFNLAIALTGTGEVVEALDLFDALLAGELGTLSDEVEGQIAERREVAERAVAHLSFRVDPDEAAVRIDGESVDGSARSLSINPGVRVIDVGAEGYLPQQRRLEVAPGAAERVAFRLEERPEPEGSSSVFESPWFWAIAGTLVVGGAVTAGVLVATQPSRPEVDETVFTLRPMY